MGSKEGIDICSEPECSRPRHARGFCANCYTRKKLAGEFTDLHFRRGPNKPWTLEELLATTKPGPNGCMEWTRNRQPAGYGKLTVRGRDVSAHRFAYELAYGAPLPGLSVLHKCDNPACINPAHLWLGTQGDNVRDAARKGRLYTGAGIPLKRRGET